MGEFDSDGLRKLINETFTAEVKDIRAFSPLNLAYIGDAIYEIIIRTVLVERANTSVNNLHKTAVKFVRAHSQAVMIESIESILTDEEDAVYKRGRNAKSNTQAKNADILDYRKATGFEALLGYLYLNGQSDRMLFLVKSAIDALGETL